MALVVALLLGQLATPGPVAAETNELEQVLVTGRQPTDAAGQNLHGFSTSVAMDDAMNSPLNLAAAIADQPGVAYNGQGGLFQTVSIRGLSRQRVGSFFLDIPILTERRAGTAASFIDPALLSSVDLVRGPATTAYGSGNLGGLIRARVAALEGATARLSWGGSGDENGQLVGFGNGSAYAALSHRGANQGETARGQPLNSGFDQYNLLLGGHHETADSTWEAVSLLSYGRDIGKSNALYPDQRVTDYPRERHWLGQLSRLSDASTSALFFHYQSLETEVVRPAQRLNTVHSSSLDFGARYASRWWHDDSWRWGLDYLGRRNVNSDEWEQQLGEESGPRQTNLRGEEDQLAGFLEGRREWGRLTATAGLRFTALRQEAEGRSRDTETLASGYLGARLPLTRGWRLSAELSRGARAANLSERYFSGTTGRGTVVGNPGLSPESADSLDLGLVHERESSRLEFHLYHMELGDFIERVPTGEDALSFRNLEGGFIRGADFRVDWQLGSRLALRLGGHWQEGENGEGDPLQDVSPNQLSTSLRYEGDRWSGTVDLLHRFQQDRVAATEQTVDSANLLGVSLRHHVSDNLALSLWGRNLLNERYLLTTDDLATEGEKAAFGVELSWQSRPR